MNYTNQLVEELEQLNFQYSRLSDMSILKKEKDNEIFRQRLILAGQAIVNYYNNTFLPKYSEIKDRIVEEAGTQLSSFVEKALYNLKNDMPFAITAILTNPGDRINSRNNLERLIIQIKEMSKQREKVVV